MARDAGTRNLTPWEFLNISGCPLGSGCVARRVIKVVIAQFAFYTAANAVSLEIDTWTGCIFHEPPWPFVLFPTLTTGCQMTISGRKTRGGVLHHRDQCKATPHSAPVVSLRL